ncbi:hypothetical protein GM418_19280 [Maribellus comscasis]|uniref:Uncharacterized protein n=1 Tax=Maribellus comscasis TaxID=2681766 RepID=A0A6I6JRR9_9BACT|nr:hypothetical protein [Maribellus comscasis]QGY45735.1 hypothetical protein GM418_19280 [Maribellus comscasis]
MKSNYFVISLISLLFQGAGISNAQKLNSFHPPISKNEERVPVKTEIHNNGYTTHWSDTYLNTFRYGNLFKMTVRDVNLSIKQSKIDIAEELGIIGLNLQEGFINELLSSDTKTVKEPSLKEMETTLKSNDVLVFASPHSEVGKKLLSLAGDINSWKKDLTAHQFKSNDWHPTDVFRLESGQRKIFAVISSDAEAFEKLESVIKNIREIVRTYDFRKGWMGIETLHMSVTTDFVHPMDVISQGMNEGNSWFVFSGYNEFRALEKYQSWMDEIGNPAFVEAGSYAPGYGQRNFVFGCDNWDGLQEQDIKQQGYVDFVKEKNGYIFRQVFDNKADEHDVYDGYIVNEGNKKQLDNQELPFVNLTSSFSGGATSSMVLFLPKGAYVNKKSIIKAIKERREVAILPQGKIIGGDYFRQAMQVLELDRIFLEDYFGDYIDIYTETNGSEVKITLTNYSNKAITGNLSLSLPSALKLAENGKAISLPANSQKEVRFPVSIEKEAMGKTNPIGIDFVWDGKKKSTVTMLDLPPAISVPQLLYGQTPVVQYPVSVHNFTKESSFPVKVQVFKTDKPGKAVFEKIPQCEVAPDTYKELVFDIKIKAGNYKLVTTALGCFSETQLGVEKAQGQSTLTTVDLNGDGVDEYQMENDKVKVTLLTIGARVIEYIVKSKDDNVLFKSWPEKPVNENQPFRERHYYPFGGFEDFLGQPSMETHKVFDAEILKSGGTSVSVKMTSDFYGNQIEKIFTLYGDSPLLEVKFKLNFTNKETDMFGPQPILALGAAHDTVDVFMVPDVKGLLKYRMRMDEYYGQIFTLTEGWQAGRDENENVFFVGAFPVDQPDFLHMWMNHPRNSSTRHYYVEFQPWIRIIKKNAMYFSYYMWADEGNWEKGVEALRERNLITKSKINVE